jgi:hypothetical protein
MRIWVVDDQIPVQQVYGAIPVPHRMSREIMQHVVAIVPEAQWEEGEVRGLCTTLCTDEFEAAFFTSPDAVERELARRGNPPHVVIFDWQGTGFSPERNVNVLTQILASSFAYVQVYTHLDSKDVDKHLDELRKRFGGRVLATRTKSEVDPAGLRDAVKAAWKGTIAGEIADAVRERAAAGVERTLIEISSLKTGEIAALAQGHADILLDVVLAKVRDELGADVSDILTEIAKADQIGGSTDGLRRFMSVWYYHFPNDNRIRNGDIVRMKDGGLALITTPSCDLAAFPTKTSGHLALVRMLPMTKETFEALGKAGCPIKGIGGSVIADHTGAGDKVVVLPNIPVGGITREKLEDWLAVSHARETVSLSGASKGWITYDALKEREVSRVCSLASPFAHGVVSRIYAAGFSPGLPDLPKGERERLNGLFKN